jgi:aryl-alcohol dehydrogenase-like predicted oxidoreductase
MMFGAIENTDHEECTRIIHKALGAGINFIDTADAYNKWESEEIIGKALKGRRDSVVVPYRIPISKRFFRCSRTWCGQ